MTGLPVGQEPLPTTPEQGAVGEVPTSPEASTGAIEMPPTEKAPELKMPKGGRI